MLACLPLSVRPAGLDEQTRIQIEALNRLKGMDLEANPALKKAVLTVVQKTRGTAEFVTLVDEFKLAGQEAALLEYALAHPDESSGVKAFRLATTGAGLTNHQELLRSTNGVIVARLLGNEGGQDSQKALQWAVAEQALPVEVAREAVRALVKSEAGANFLLEQARGGTLRDALRLAASEGLNLAPWPAIRQSAAELIPLPQGRDAKPLPPVAVLSKRSGDPRRGREIFFGDAALCSSCHEVNGHGSELGPGLSEIGTKLGKEALYEAILDPSSGIAFGYEAWSIELKNGDELYGLVLGETAESISVKTQGGIVREVGREEIQARRRMSTSMMPAGLQLTMSTEELVDLVEYLSQLRKPGAP